METKYISLLSGKGGAGKTVIGLSIARVLYEVGYKVLFIDCDLSTHGASYFWKMNLNPKKNILVCLRLYLLGKTKPIY